jgi:hypothetical protein
MLQDFRSKKGWQKDNTRCDFVFVQREGLAKAPEERPWLNPPTQG